jgi:hypothetical protein
MALNSRPDDRGRHVEGVAGFGKQLAVARILPDFPPIKYSTH